MVVEDPPGDVEQIADERVTQRVMRGGAVAAHGDDAVVAKDGELLRDEGLVEVQELLELVDGVAAPAEDLEQPDAHGVGERAEEAGLEDLQIARRGRPRAPGRVHDKT